MSDTAIRVERLGKQYRIGRAAEPYATLRDLLANRATRIAAAFSRNVRAAEQTTLFWALRDISFEVNRGDVVGVIGRNGAGKTTLLKILSRITDPTEGRAEIHGRVASLLEVGTGFHPELSGRENIYLNGAILGMRKAEIQRNFDAIVAFAELDRFIDTPVKHYSSGMYVRLAFAVAAHLEPEILLVDEVLAVGDTEFQKKCLGKMEGISREGRTVFLVSHNMPSIVNLCQRAVLLRDGHVVADGKASEVVQRYLTMTRSSAAEIVWRDPGEAPGDAVVRLHAARIIQEGVDGATADVDISKDVLVEIEYWAIEDGARLYAGFWLRDKIGTYVLSTGNATSVSLTDDRWFGRPHPCGLFKSVCRLPGNFLNEGLYSVSVILGRVPNRTIVLEDYALSFHVHDTGEMRQEYYGEWIGTVRPKLAWQTECVLREVSAL